MMPLAAASSGVMMPDHVQHHDAKQRESEATLEELRCTHTVGSRRLTASWTTQLGVAGYSEALES